MYRSIGEVRTGRLLHPNQLQKFDVDNIDCTLFPVDNLNGQGVIVVCIPAGPEADICPGFVTERHIAVPPNERSVRVRGLPSCWGCKALPTPIDQLTKNYLGLRVSFARLSPDGSICGVTACRAAHSSPISCRNHTSRLFQEVTFFEQTGFLYLYKV